MTQPTFDDIFSNHARAFNDQLASNAEFMRRMDAAAIGGVDHRAVRHGTFILDTANLAFAELRADPVAWALEEAERAEWDGVIGDGVEGDS